MLVKPTLHLRGTHLKLAVVHEENIINYIDAHQSVSFRGKLAEYEAITFIAIPYDFDLESFMTDDSDVNDVMIRASRTVTEGHKFGTLATKRSCHK